MTAKQKVKNKLVALGIIIATIGSIGNIDVLIVIGGLIGTIGTLMMSGVIKW